jgi:hypothetical protein
MSDPGKKGVLGTDVDSVQVGGCLAAPDPQKPLLREPIATSEVLAGLARSANRDPADLAEIWSERAAIREYLAGTPRAEAERLALDDVRRLVQP